MSSRRWIRQGQGPSSWTLEHRGRTEASLQWQGWADAFRLTFAGENWTVDVTGTWSRRIVVREGGQQRYDGTLQGHGAAISGHPYGPLEWRRAGRWRPVYELQADGRPALARLHVRRREALVTVETGLPDAIPLLAVGLVAHLTAAADGRPGAILGSVTGSLASG